MNGNVKSSSREHKSRTYWMQAVQNRPNSTGRLTGAPKFNPNVPRGDSHDYFSSILRRNIGPGNTGTGTLPPTARPGEVPFLSTSDYLREQFGLVAMQALNKPTDSKLPPGTPYYKTPEEYYDEVLELRKQITEMIGENSVLKAKQRRLEDKLGKKDKELINIFEKKLDKTDTSKLVEQSVGRGDKNTIVHNLKLRLFKMEQKFKAKDAEYKRIEADLKRTEVDELRHQLDICLGQISTLRYHNAKILSGHVSDRSTEAIQAVVTKAVERYEEYSDDTESFTSDSETGYQGRRSRSHSRSASASRSVHRPGSASSRRALPVESKPVPVALPAPPPPPEEKPQVSDRPKCTIKEHQRLEDVGIELEKALQELERRHEALDKGNGSVRTKQKLTLKGRPADRLLALDSRETELLKVVNELTKEIDELKEKLKHMDTEMVKHKERAEADAAAELQSILRAHNSRVAGKEELIDEVERQLHHQPPHHPCLIVEEEVVEIVEHEYSDDPEHKSIVEMQSIIRAHLERAYYESANARIIES